MVVKMGVEWLKNVEEQLKNVIKIRPSENVIGPVNLTYPVFLYGT